MNLNKTWKLCLSMWRWIAEQRRRNSYEYVSILKEEWLRKHGFNPDGTAYLPHCISEHNPEEIQVNRDGGHIKIVGN